MSTTQAIYNAINNFRKIHGRIPATIRVSPKDYAESVEPNSITVYVHPEEVDWVFGKLSCTVVKCADVPDGAPVCEGGEE